MSAFIDTIRSGKFLTRERMRLWSLAVLAASAIGVLYIVATSDGLNDFLDRPLGTDFSNVYAAGTYVLEGKASAAFDWPLQHAREQAIFGDKTPFYGWHYPPFFLFIAGALALMPYVLALLVWQTSTFALYLFALRAILSTSCPVLGRASTPSLSYGQQGVDGRDTPGHDDRAGYAPLDRMWLLLAVAFPAVFVNIGHGHNGFLTAALIGAALVMLDRRPVLAGILFGLLAYKPQFGVLIPLVLIATGRWRVFAAAALTVAALVVATLLAFGPEAWRAFFASLPLTRVEVLEQGGTGWHKIQSVFSWVRMWGGGVPLAYMAQGFVTITIAASIIALWRSQVFYALKAAALSIGAILATPYTLDYDLVALAPAIAFLAADGMTRGFAPWHKSSLAFLWLMPLIARTIAEQSLIPLGVPAMLAVLSLILLRAANDAGLFARWHSSAQPIK